MDKTRLLELAGVQLNEKTDDVTITLSRDVLGTLIAALEVMEDFEEDDDSLKDIEVASKIVNKAYQQ